MAKKTSQKKRTGTLYRRLKGRDYSIDDPAASGGTIWLQYRSNGKTYRESLKTSDLSVHSEMRVNNLSRRYDAEKPGSSLKSDAKMTSDWKLNFLGRTGSSEDEFLFASSFTGQVSDGKDATGSVLIYKYNDAFEYQWVKRVTNTDRRLETGTMDFSSIVYGDGFVVITGHEEAQGNNTADVLTVIKSDGQIVELRIPGFESKPVQVLDIQTMGQEIFVLARSGDHIHYATISGF